MRRSGKQALEQLSKGTANGRVNGSAVVQQGQDIEEVASEAVKVFKGLETMRGSSDECEAGAEAEDIGVWSVSLALLQKSE